MEIKLKLVVIFFLFSLLASCKISRETINLCGTKYDVITQTPEYAYEEDLLMQAKTVCFKNSRYPLLTYLCKGTRGNDSTNFIHTILETNCDTIIIKTIYDKSVYDKGQESIYIDKYLCTTNGVISIDLYGRENYVITKEVQKKMKHKIKRKHCLKINGRWNKIPKYSGVDKSYDSLFKNKDFIIGITPQPPK